MLRLTDAPFDVTDAKLVPKAGACNACPKRTGNQAQLFADVKSPDLCIDPACFKAKKAALFAIRLKEAKAGGQEVLEGKAADRATHGGGYRKLDDSEWVGNKRKTVRELVKKAKPPITLALDSRGEVHELVRQADVMKVLPKEEREHAGDNDKWKKAAKQREAKERRRAQAVSLAVATAVQKTSKLGPKLVPLLVRALIRSAWDDSCQAIMRSRGLEKKKGSFRGAQAAVLAHASTLRDDELAGLGLEMALRKFAPTRHGAADPEWRDTLQALKIDFAGIERLLANQAKTKAAVKKKTTKRKAKS